MLECPPSMPGRNGWSIEDAERAATADGATPEEAELVRGPGPSSGPFSSPDDSSSSSQAFFQLSSSFRRLLVLGGASVPPEGIFVAEKSAANGVCTGVGCD